MEDDPDRHHARAVGRAGRAGLDVAARPGRARRRGRRPRSTCLLGARGAGPGAVPRPVHQQRRLRLPSPPPASASLDQAPQQPAAGTDHGHHRPRRRARPRRPPSPAPAPGHPAGRSLVPQRPQAHRCPTTGSADWCLVPEARTQFGLSTFLVEAPDAELVPAAGPVPQARPPGARRTEGATMVGPEGDHTAIWRRIADDTHDRRSAPSSSRSMERANDLAVEYAKVRVQFDRPIATFQVIKHKAADMLHRLELSGSAPPTPPGRPTPTRPTGRTPRPWPRATPPRPPATSAASASRSTAASASRVALRGPPPLPQGQAGRPPARLPGLAAPAPGRPATELGSHRRSAR